MEKQLMKSSDALDETLQEKYEMPMLFELNLHGIVQGGTNEEQETGGGIPGTDPGYEKDEEQDN